MAEHLGNNTEELIQTAKHNGGKARSTTFKLGTQIKTIARTSNGNTKITKQTSFAHGGKEGILKDQHQKV